VNVSALHVAIEYLRAPPSRSFVCARRNRVCAALSGIHPEGACVNASSTRCALRGAGDGDDPRDARPGMPGGFIRCVLGLARRLHVGGSWRASCLRVDDCASAGRGSPSVDAWASISRVLVVCARVRGRSTHGHVTRASGALCVRELPTACGRGGQTRHDDLLFSTVSVVLSAGRGARNPLRDRRLVGTLAVSSCMSSRSAIGSSPSGRHHEGVSAAAVLVLGLPIARAAPTSYSSGVPRFRDSQPPYVTAIVPSSRDSHATNQKSSLFAQRASPPFAHARR